MGGRCSEKEEEPALLLKLQLMGASRDKEKTSYYWRITRVSPGSSTLDPQNRLQEGL